MKYTVAWSLFAETQLADIWVHASNRQDITNASDQIYRELKKDPDKIGVPDSQGWRVIVVPPLAATFEVSIADRLATVLDSLPTFNREGIAMKPRASNEVLNVPNVLTTLRFLLSVVVFILIPLHHYFAAMTVFIIAASTDWIDGWWARKFNQVTKLGRIFDPFVDKIIICGTFIYLAAETNSGVAPWMAVVVVGREMLVTAIRGFIEQQGGDFSAQMAGKLKMVFQCVAAAASLLALWYWQQAQLDGARTMPIPDWLFWTLHASVWLAVISTVYSGLEYIVAAARILSRQGN